MAQSPIFVIIKLLFNPDVSKKMILQMAFQQVKVIGYAKVLAAALSGVVVAGSSVVKIPQIRTIVTPPTLRRKISVANGISSDGLHLELLSQLIHVVYNVQTHNPFINYGETVLIGLQNVAILLLVKYYRLRQHFSEISNSSEKEQIEYSLKELQKPIAVIIGIVVFFAKIAPPALIDLLQILNIPISIASRIPQIKLNHVLKSTAHLSNVTIGANTIGSAIRCFTTIKRSSGKSRRASDNVLLAGYAAGLVSNLVLVGQAICYRKNQLADSDNEDKKNI